MLYTALAISNVCVCSRSFSLSLSLSRDVGQYNYYTDVRHGVWQIQRQRLKYCSFLKQDVDVLVCGLEGPVTSLAILMINALLEVCLFVCLSVCLLFCLVYSFRGLSWVVVIWFIFRFTFL